MHATDIQCVALTGFAAVDEPDAVGLLVGPAVAPADVIWKNGGEPAPPGSLGNPGDRFGFTMTTLPTELVADDTAASVAAVDRSPATAAKAFWNSPS